MPEAQRRVRREHTNSGGWTVLIRSTVILLGLMFISGCGGESDESGTSQGKLFEVAPVESTGIAFENKLSEQPTPHRTELLYEYFANGGGVAVGDLNGDGLEDIYFTANMSFNELYINKGGLEFEEVARRSGARGRKNTWNTGVTMVDINGDELLDIYVCYSGDLPLDRRVDELYVNQGPDEEGVPQFEERAEAYGLANPHSSNQAYFFDYDRDGDLDLFLQTHNVKTLPRGAQRSQQRKLSKVDTVNGNRFYENRGGQFVDVTEEVGIHSSPLTYGLGAGIADFNDDGWPDIYVGNDYSPPDYLYINTGDGTFTNKIDSSIGHISRASMGVDVSDINNDGFSDIVVLDMLPEDNYRQKLLYVPYGREYFMSNVNMGFHYQYTFNTLQINNGNSTFSEVGRMSGVSTTDWSWSPLIADYDNDGRKDLFITNGILHDVTNRDFLKYKQNYLESKNYDLNPKDVSTLMRNLPSSNLENYAFKNEGNMNFDDVSKSWNLDKNTNSNGAAYTDLDNDGDVDIITNNINEPASVFVNRASEQRNHHYLKIRLRGSGSNTFGLGSKVTVYVQGEQQYAEQYPTRGYLSSVSPVLHFGLGDRRRVDSLRIVWPDQKEQVLTDIQADQILTLWQRDASMPERGSESVPRLFQRVDPPFTFDHEMGANIDDFQRQPLLVTPKSFDGPSLATSDITGNGHKDVFVGGGHGQESVLYLQVSEGTFTSRTPSAFKADKAGNDVDATFLDVNDDGHPDLYVASGGYWGVSTDDPVLQDRLYINDGTGHFTKKTEALPQMRTSTGAIVETDVNGDGASDLFVGGRVIPGRYPEPPRSYVLVNDGEGNYTDRTDAIAPELTRVGMVTDAAWNDLNEDGAGELVVVGDWMPIRIFERKGERLGEASDLYFDREYRGLWNTVEIEDINNDGSPDLIAGNHGQNTHINATEDHPAHIHYADYDDDGSPDPIFSYYNGDERYPQLSLDRLREHIPPLGYRFSSYESYAQARLDDVLSDQELQESKKLEANFLETAMFVMEEGKRFEKKELPTEAQISPVYSIRFLESESGERKSVLLSGNMNHARVRFGKQDANYGVFLEADEHNEFDYVPQHLSGLDLRGDIRDVVEINGELLFGVNDGGLVSYELKRK